MGVEEGLREIITETMNATKSQKLSFHSGIALVLFLVDSRWDQICCML